MVRLRGEWRGAPARRFAAARDRARAPAVRPDRATHMLSGLLTCACGGRIAAAGTWRRPSGTVAQSMRCWHFTADRPSGAGCPHRLATRQEYEEQATAWVLALPDRLAERHAPDPGPDTAEARAALDARRQRLNVAWVEGGMPEPTYRAMLAALELDAARLPASALRRETIGAALTVARESWLTMLDSPESGRWHNRLLRSLGVTGLVTGRDLALFPGPDLAALLAP